MASEEQKTSLAYKQFFGRNFSQIEKKYFEEPYASRPIVYNSQLLLGTIPSVSPLGAPNVGIAGVSGNVELIKDAVMSPIGGESNAFVLSSLKNAISFDYDPNGSYLYHLTKNSGDDIPFGCKDWVVDTSAGTLVFMLGAPDGVSNLLPPKISFYRYVGAIGASANAIQIQGVNVSATAPLNNQILVYSSTTSQWEPSSLISGDDKRIVFPLQGVNLTIGSTVFTNVGRYNWINSVNSGFGTVRVIVNVLISGPRELNIRVFNATAATVIGGPSVSTGTGTYIITITNPTSDALLELQCSRTVAAGSSPIMRAAHMEFEY